MPMIALDLTCAHQVSTLISDIIDLVQHWNILSLRAVVKSSKRITIFVTKERNVAVSVRVSILNGNFPSVWIWETKLIIAVLR